MLRSGELDTIQVVVLHGTVLLSLSLIDARGLQFRTEDDDAGLLGEDGADILVVVAVGIVEALGHRLLSIHLASGRDGGYFPMSIVSQISKHHKHFLVPSE